MILTSQICHFGRHGVEILSQLFHSLFEGDDFLGFFFQFVAEFRDGLFQRVEGEFLNIFKLIRCEANPDFKDFRGFW